jgi:hypothetical protein
MRERDEERCGDKWCSRWMSLLTIWTSVTPRRKPIPYDTNQHINLLSNRMKTQGADTVQGPPRNLRNLAGRTPHSR